MLDDGLLDWVEHAVLRQPFDGDDLAPSHSTASTMQLLTGSPFSSTVQAPHSPAVQPFFVPVSASFSRSICSRVMLEGTSTCSVFTVDRQVIFDGLP